MKYLLAIFLILLFAKCETPSKIIETYSVDSLTGKTTKTVQKFYDPTPTPIYREEYINLDPFFYRPYRPYYYNNYPIIIRPNFNRPNYGRPYRPTPTPHRHGH